MIDSLATLLVHLLVQIFTLLLPVLFPLAVIITLIRVFTGRHPAGIGHFVITVFILPFRMTFAVLRVLWRWGRRSAPSVINLVRGDPARGARRTTATRPTAAARATVRKPAYLVGDDRPAANSSDYTREKFEDIWREDLGDLGEPFEDD